MKTLDILRASRPLSEYTRALGRSVLVLTSRKRPIAALVPLQAGDQESLMISSNPRFRKIIANARKEFAAGRKVTLGEMRKAVSAMHA